MACAAALATINVLLRDDLAAQAQHKGDYLLKGLKACAKRYPQVITAVRGKGFLQALVVLR